MFKNAAKVLHLALILYQTEAFCFALTALTVFGKYILITKQDQNLLFPAKYAEKVHLTVLETESLYLWIVQVVVVVHHYEVLQLCSQEAAFGFRAYFRLAANVILRFSVQTANKKCQLWIVVVVQVSCAQKTELFIYFVLVPTQR